MGITCNSNGQKQSNTNFPVTPRIFHQGGKGIAKSFTVTQSTPVITLLLLAASDRDEGTW